MFLFWTKCLSEELSKLGCWHIRIEKWKWLYGKKLIPQLQKSLAWKLLKTMEEVWRKFRMKFKQPKKYQDDGGRWNTKLISSSSIDDVLHSMEQYTCCINCGQLCTATEIHNWLMDHGNVHKSVTLKINWIDMQLCFLHLPSHSWNDRLTRQLIFSILILHVAYMVARSSLLTVISYCNNQNHLLNPSGCPGCRKEMHASLACSLLGLGAVCL